MNTIFLIILTLVLCIIITIVVAIVYNYVNTKISQSKSCVVDTEITLLRKKKHDVPLPAKEEGLYVIGVSSLSLLLVFLAVERGIPVTLVVFENPGSISLSFPHNVADFIKRHYACESVHDMIAMLPKSVIVIPEETLLSLPDTGVRVESSMIKDPFFMVDELCGKPDSVILIKRSCVRS